MRSILALVLSQCLHKSAYGIAFGKLSNCIWIFNIMQMLMTCAHVRALKDMGGLSYLITHFSWVLRKKTQYRTPSRIIGHSKRDNGPFFNHYSSAIDKLHDM